MCQEQVILRTKQNCGNIGRILCIDFHIVMVRMKALQWIVMEWNAIIIRKTNQTSFIDDFYLKVNNFQKLQRLRDVPPLKIAVFKSQKLK